MGCRRRAGEPRRRPVRRRRTISLAEIAAGVRLAVRTPSAPKWGHGVGRVTARSFNHWRLRALFSLHLPPRLAISCSWRQSPSRWPPAAPLPGSSMGGRQTPIRPHRRNNPASPSVPSLESWLASARLLMGYRRRTECPPKGSAPRGERRRRRSGRRRLAHGRRRRYIPD